MKMLFRILVVVSAVLPPLINAQELLHDSGISGQPLEVVHLYNDQWPTGTSILDETTAQL